MKIVQFPGLDVVVRVGQQSLREIGHDSTIPGAFHPSSLSYVETKPGEDFSVHVSCGEQILHMCEHAEADLLAAFYIDGNFIDDVIFERINMPDEWELTGIEIPNGSDNIFRKLKFQKLGIVEGTTSARQVRAMKLGQINVVVYRVDIIGRMRERPRLVSSLATPLTISGKDAAKRCLSLKTGLGEPETAEPTDFVDVDYIDPKDRPLAEFTFLYRTKRELQTLGLMPADPIPSPRAQAVINAGPTPQRSIGATECVAPNFNTDAEKGGKFSRERRRYFPGPDDEVILLD